MGRRVYGLLRAPSVPPAPACSCPPPPPPPPPRRPARRSRSSRRGPPAPPRCRLPPGCWPRSPRPSPGSHRRLSTAEMARRCRLRPPGHYPVCPGGPRGGRIPPTSCPRPLCLPGAVRFSFAGSWEAGAEGGGWRFRGRESFLFCPGSSPSFGDSPFSVDRRVLFRWYFSREMLYLLVELRGAERNELGGYRLQF